MVPAKVMFVLVFPAGNANDSNLFAHQPAVSNPTSEVPGGRRGEVAIHWGKGAGSTGGQRKEDEAQAGRPGRKRATESGSLGGPGG